MANGVALRPDWVRAQMAALRRRFDEEKHKHEAAEKEGRRIDQQIKALQNQCPHPKTTSVPFTDGPGVGYQNICCDCGAEVPGR